MAFYAPLGEFHPAWSVRGLESTKIVLGNIQPKNCPIDLGSTIITNHLNIRIMQDRKSQKNFERALMHEIEKIKIAARQWHSNNTKGYRDFRSKEAISKSFSEIAVLCMS